VSRQVGAAIDVQGGLVEMAPGRCYISKEQLIKHHL